MDRRRINESPEARERRLAQMREYQRMRYSTPEMKRKRAEYWQRYQERQRTRTAPLPPLDWAICARGGSDAQAQAHYRRGEKPCEGCRIKRNEARQKRQDKRRKLRWAS